MMGKMVPEHVEQAIRSAMKTSVASSWHFFPHINDDARSKSHQIKLYVLFSLQLLSETFLFLRRTERHMIRHAKRSSCKVPAILVRF